MISQGKMLIKINQLLLHIIIISILLITITTCIEYRPIDGGGNNRDNPTDGTPQSPLDRFPNITKYGEGPTPFQMVSTPGDYGVSDPNTSCDAPLPSGDFPLPRCVSDLITSMRLQISDTFNNPDYLEKFKSKRKNSHILTYWAFFVRMDVVTAPAKGPLFPNGVYIPLNDSIYLSSYLHGPQATEFAYTDPSFPFNRSLEKNGDHTGINTVTSFLDASTIYGSSELDLQQFRDSGGKMKLNTYNDLDDGQFGYPPINSDGDYNVGIKSPTKNVFTDMFATIFLREHNRLVDQFRAIHGDWSDDQLFQEARKWVIAFIQKITYYEYLGTALGVPLPPYQGYKPEIRPAIDTFFSTVAFRYGHSEISDLYNIVNGQGDPLAVLSLHDLKIKNLLKFYGVPSLILSLALQRQEEVDIYFSEFMRSYHMKPFDVGSKPVDIAALDIVRSRDHGIPLYNDAREAFGLQRKQTFAEISSDPDVQQKLASTYTSVDQIEAFMGGLAEDHINGGNYGELISTSFYQTWSRIRDSDRFWYENKEVSGFSDNDISEIQTTTLLEIISRNTPPTNYPQNIWFVQPPALSAQPGQGYGYSVSLADGFNLQWKIEGSDVIFLITVSSINSWFGIGFNPDGPAMQGTDMMIFSNSNDAKFGVEGKNYLGIGRAVKPKLLPDDDQIIELTSGTKVENGFTIVEVKRPLNAKNRKSLIGQIQMVYAWNLNSKFLAYHGGNRGTKEVNLLTGESASFAVTKGKRLFLMHGIVMFSIWGVLFPTSVWIVRYLRHIDSYMTQHRNLNLLGGAVVAAFCAVAMSEVDLQASSPHAITGLVIFSVTGLQIALGLLAIWALANVESASTGIVRYLRHFHFYLGGALLLTAWANIYLGIIQYDIKYYSGNGSHKLLFIWIYTGWLAMFGFMITGSEFYYRIKNMQFLWPARHTDDLSNRIRNCIPDNVFENLPAITWNEFNQRVMTGANLVIAQGLVFDIHKWIPIHPGGQKILQRVVGTDITDDFFFDPSVITVINSNFSKKYSEKTNQHSISVLTDNMYREKDRTENSMKPFSVANAVDMVNATAFRNRRVAIHRHSKFATSKLATMVIARVVDPIDEGVNLSPTSPTSTPTKQQKLGDINISILNSNNDLNDSQQTTPYSPYIFRRYILTNIETVSRNDSIKPVKKFTFQVIHPKDRLPKFLPGDYIEIMSYTNNHVIIRPYTPLQGPTENSFCILVKIYNDGAMSQHLDKQLKNFEIKVRGPFDIADRMLQTISSSSIKSPSITSRPSSPSLSHSHSTGVQYDRKSELKQRSLYSSMSRGNSVYQSGIGNANVVNNILDGRSGILLNKEREDLCWDHLFMVCGGTGITPMLQLIQYHMDKAATLGSNFNLYLLNANDTIADLIQPAYLDYLCTVLKGRLRITYILSNPPPIWRGLKGMIDDALLFDWIYQNYSVPPPAIPPRLSTNYSVGSGSKTNSMASTNTITNFSPPGSKMKNFGKSGLSDLDEIQTQQQYDQYDPQSQFRASNNRMSPPPPIQIPVQTQTSSSQHSPNSNLPYYFSPLHNPHHTNEMILLNERYNYMKSLAMDNSNQVKLVVCGSNRFNDSIRRSLEKLGFPIDEKALFIA